MKNFFKAIKLFLLLSIFLLNIKVNGQNAISYIDTRFCNQGFEESKLTSELSLVAKPGEEKEICVIHFNRHNEDIQIRGSFTPSIMEENGNRICDSNYDRDNQFSRFIKPFKEELITIPASSSAVRKTSIKFPIGVQGLQKGCFSYGLDPGVTPEGQMFLFRVRKVSYINILVQGDSKIESKIDIDNFSNQIDQAKKLQIQFDIQNNGSVNESLEIKGTLSNMFGYQQTFSTQPIIIGTNDKITLDTKDFGIDIEIPRYKGPFKLDLEITHKPHFDFDISNYGIDSKLLEGGSFDYKKSIFLFPTLPLIGIIVFLALIYMAFFKKPKVIIQQVPVNNPNPPQQ